MATKASKGRYKSTVFLGTLGGKRKYKVFYAETASEADLLALQYKFDKKEKSDPGRITIGEAIDDYIAAKSNVLSPSTLRSYKSYRRNRFQNLMDYKVSDVSTIILQKAINKESSERSAKMVKNAYGLVILGIQFYRPDFTPKVTLPTERPIEYATPDGDHLKQIMDAAKGTWLELPILLSAWMSLRQSEIIGLKWEDVFEDYIYVRNARVYSENGIVEKGTKTYSSIRKIPLPQYIKNLIDATPKDSQYIVDCPGKKITDAFVKMLRDNNIPHCRFHDLRHANASIMVMLGIPDRYAQTRGGWANGTTLSKRYQQTFAAEEIKVANTIDDYFSNLMHTKIHTKEDEIPINTGIIEV